MAAKPRTTVSRRRFLEVAACAVPGALAGGRWISQPSARSAAGRACALVDLGTDCALPESLNGFARGLAIANVPFRSLPVERLTDFFSSADSALDNVMLVPGAALRSPGVAVALRGLIDRGATVVYESGAAYADAEDFATERNLLQQHFGVSVEAPIDLWGPNNEAGFAPYVHYDWPERLVVRDFSRATPISKPQQAFASIDRLAVAERIRFGAGEFIFLGSPLGPHVGSGDREAQALLHGLIRRCPALWPTVS